MLISQYSTCAICGGALDRPYAGTSGVPFASNPRLHAYYGAPLHIDCLAGWADREEFCYDLYVSELASCWLRNGALVVAQDWFLSCGPAKPGEYPHYAQVHVLSWPFRYYSEWHEWQTYVSGGFRRKLDELLLNTAEAVMAQVLEHAPTAKALEALYAARPASVHDQCSLVEFGNYMATLWGAGARRTDWWSLEEECRALREALDESERLRSEEIAHSNEIAVAWARRLAIGASLECPHCHRWTHELRYFNLSPRGRSYFVCQSCGRSFAGSE